jgi:excisionase family DNA binding protein
MRKRVERTSPELNDRIAVTVDRAGDILDVGRSTIYALLREQKLKTINVRNTRRITMRSIRELAESE